MIELSRRFHRTYFRRSFHLHESGGGAYGSVAARAKRHRAVPTALNKLDVAGAAQDFYNWIWDLRIGKNSGRPAIPAYMSMRHFAIGIIWMQAAGNNNNIGNELCTICPRFMEILLIKCKLDDGANAFTLRKLDCLHGCHRHAFSTGNKLILL